ncbi:SICA antigen [Plasmodium coatneyi]|uniref:SICA antigen n=1 Tax=Plasmodium coatneyi TaxID=208452 RepID=A0A1B1E0L9_9APIC|nr:SICA antigen [Plasmodium coatneyi]ANQ08520.1 SICA antigen [Plasmodium coatneyi]
MSVHYFSFLNSQQKIWDDMKAMFQEVTDRLKNDEDRVKLLCESVDHRTNTNAVIKKELCKALLRIIYFINGFKPGNRINQGWKVKEALDVEKYLRCVVGNVTIMKLFGGHCRMKEVSQYVKGIIDETSGVHNIEGVHENCQSVPLDELILGKRLVSTEMEPWIENIASGINSIKQIRYYNKCVTDTNIIHDSSIPIRGSTANIRKILGRKEKDEQLKELLDDKGDISKDDVKKIVQKVKEIKERRKNPCSESLTGGFEQGEEVGIEEWLTEFSNLTVNNSDYYDYDRVENVSALCDDDDTFKTANVTDGYKKFCRVLIKNLWIVSKCHDPKYTGNKCIKGGSSCYYVEPCDLLKIWLMYVRGLCIPGEVVQGIFEAVEQVKTFFENNGTYKECDLKSFPSLYREDADMLYNISELLRNSELLRKQLGSRELEWCEAVPTGVKWVQWVDTRISQSLGRSNAAVTQTPELEKMKQIIEKTEKRLKEDKEELEQISEVITQVTEQSSGQGSGQGTNPGSPPPIQPSSVGENCTTAGADLCTRVQCVTNKYHQNNGGTSPTWSEMQGEIDRSATEMFKKISTNSTEVPPYCIDAGKQSRRVTDPERKACTYITEGLKYIYNIAIDKKDLEDQDANARLRARDNRLFKQTMLCLVLNAYADKLKDHVTSPCEVSEQTIIQAFEKGNELIDKWCEGKKNGGKMECVVCKREDYKTCKIDYNGKEEEIEPKLNAMLQKNGQKKELDRGISSTFNSLCSRVQCVITQKTREKRDKTSKEVWEDAAWDDAKGDVLKDLSEALTKGNGEDEDECKRIGGKDGTRDGANKRACNYIVNGLKHIYSITQDSQGTTDHQHKKNSRIFKQTMSCFILNVYAELLKGKCIDENTIMQAFNAEESFRTMECTGGKCEQCKWDNCTEFIIGQKNSSRRNEIKGELEKNKDIKPTLSTIDTLCNPQTAKPEAVRPPDSAARNESTSEDGSVAKSAPAPVEKTPKKAVQEVDPEQQGTGKSRASDTKKIPKKVDCNSHEADEGVDIEACLSLDGDQPTTPSAVDLDEKNEADHRGGVVGEPGSQMGKVDIVQVQLMIVKLQALRTQTLKLLPDLQELKQAQVVLMVVKMVVEVVVDLVRDLVQHHNPPLLHHHNKVVTNHKVHLPQGNHPIIHQHKQEQQEQQQKEYRHLLLPQLLARLTTFLITLPHTFLPLLCSLVCLL